MSSKIEAQSQQTQTARSETQPDIAAGVAARFADRVPGINPLVVEISYRLGAAAAANKAASERLFKLIGVGGTTSRFGVLRVLYFSAECRTSLSDIRDQMNVAPPNVTYLVGSLEDQGLVSRSPHPTDGRVTWIELTQAGKEVCALLFPAMADQMTNLVRGFTGEEMLLFSDFLRRLHENADASQLERS